jgi:hypothetical protein
MIPFITGYIKKNGFMICLITAIIVIICLSIYSYITNKSGTLEKKKIYEFDLLGDRSKHNFRSVSKSKDSKDSKDSKGEIECRRVLRKIFNREFGKIRPDFLKNYITGNMYNLEIDCFDDKLKLGVEYNGRQHYEYIPFFHKTKDSFYNQKYRDDMKRRLCNDNGIILVEVPFSVKIHDIEKYIIDQLKANSRFKHLINHYLNKQ